MMSPANGSGFSLPSSFFYFLFCTLPKLKPFVIFFKQTFVILTLVTFVHDYGNYVSSFEGEVMGNDFCTSLFINVLYNCVVVF